MVQVKVQPHPDGICCNKKINIAILIQFHLRIAGTRAEPAHHHRGPASLTPHEFGNLIHIRHTKGHDRAAPRQTSQFL